MSAWLRCATPGCVNPATRGPRCALCHARWRAQADARRPDKNARGYGSGEHARWRRQVLARDPLCGACGAAAATHADHILPVRLGGTWALDNGQGLCGTCHSRKTALRDGGFGHAR